MSKTLAQILETWETEGQKRDWYAVDSYDAETGAIHRLMVGDHDEAAQFAAARASGAGLTSPAGDELAEPGEYGPYPFYRATLISPKAARDYFLVLHESLFANDLPEHSNELIPVSQAAVELGISRQSAYGLVDRGAIPSENVDGIRVGRYSVYLRNAAKRKHDA